VIAECLDTLSATLTEQQMDWEIVVVEDHCSDATHDIVGAYSAREPRIRAVQNPERGGFGMAVRCGLDHFTGDAVAIVMADSSDSPEDLVRYFRIIEGGAECVFGSRFITGGKVVDYPTHKLIMNRLANLFIRILFRHGLNDTTNAFKCYRREVIEGCGPLLAVHFNLTVELPLKAVIRGYRYEVVPISWQNRKAGVSKLAIKEMGSRYFFIIFYCLLERWLTGPDYHRAEVESG
jgi:dolichol-phosphate mannosyltransferase